MRRFTRRAAIGVGALGAVGAGTFFWAERKAGAADAAYPPIGAVETVDGVRMHVLDLGPKDAPAVVLIHGASGNLRDFAFSLAPRLAKRFRVIAVDRPGFGHSERGPERDAHRPERQAALMRGAVAARGVTRSVVVGHSLGGASTLAWALDAPESVIGVVGLAPVLMPWPGDIAFHYHLGATPVLGSMAMTTMGALLSEDTLVAAIDSFFAPQTAPEGYAEYVGVGLAIRRETMRFNARDIALLKPILREQATRYPELAMPIEILHGDADAIVSADVHANPFARLAPTAQVAEPAGVGHMPHHAVEDAVAAAIERVAAQDGASGRLKGA